MNEQTDSQLLRAYAENHSEPAFAELVRRHVDLVYSAALRRVCDSHLAEDVTQGAFVALARSAPQLTERTVLSSWLHRTAQNIAAQTVRTDVRRRAREEEAAATNELFSTESDAVWEHIAPHLDAALGELSEADRDALLLRYFERKSAQEMAQVLGVSDQAAQKRVSRAVERLREFFAKRGVTIGSSGLAVAISANAVQSAPIGLAVAISTSAALLGTAIASTATSTASKTIAMGTSQKSLIAAALLAAATVPLYRQHSAIQTLRAENARARDLTVSASRESSSAQGLNPFEAAELERLRQEHQELLRLRGEVSLMRQQLAESVVKRSAPSAPPASRKEPEQPPEPVQIFVANADANVPAGQTLAFGGWTTAEGKRTVVFVKPRIENLPANGRVGEILLEGRFVEMPEEVMNSVAANLGMPGLETLKADGKASAVHTVFTGDEAALLLKTLENSAGVDVLSSPRIQTGAGMPAEMSVTQQKKVAGQEHTLGPSLRVEPRIGADGSSVNLTVFAQLRKANAAE